MFLVFVFFLIYLLLFALCWLLHVAVYYCALKQNEYSCNCACFCFWDCIFLLQLHASDMKLTGKVFDKELIPFTTAVSEKHTRHGSNPHRVQRKSVWWWSGKKANQRFSILGSLVLLKSLRSLFVEGQKCTRCKTVRNCAHFARVTMQVGGYKISYLCHTRDCLATTNGNLKRKPFICRECTRTPFFEVWRATRLFVCIGVAQKPSSFLPPSTQRQLSNCWYITRSVKRLKDRFPACTGNLLRCFGLEC